MIGKIELKDMLFFAHHGCFEQEKIIGNKFSVDFDAEYDMSTAIESDSIEDALNYQAIYNVIKEQMEISSNLLEHVANRIIVSLKSKFPDIISANISISKINPPLGGEVGCSKVILNYKREWIKG